MGSTNLTHPCQDPAHVVRSIRKHLLCARKLIPSMPLGSVISLILPVKNIICTCCYWYGGWANVHFHHAVNTVRSLACLQESFFYFFVLNCVLFRFPLRDLFLQTCSVIFWPLCFILKEFTHQKISLLSLGKIMTHFMKDWYNFLKILTSQSISDG